MILFLLLLFFGCSEPSESMKKEIIVGRSGQALYSIHVPLSWNRKELASSNDTTRPIAEFEGKGFKVVIHNFPHMKIPNAAQVGRWKKQNPDARIIETSFNGYQGLILEDEALIAIALEVPSNKTEEKYAPVTLKATGQVSSKEILKTAKTFMTLEPFP